MTRRLKKLHLATFLVLVGFLATTITGCSNKPDSIAGRVYWYQCYWVGGPNDFSPYAEFNDGGVLVHHDDTATITGTWSNVEETVIWTLNNPPKNTSFRGTYDRKAIQGNISDDLGGSGWFQGSRR
ncbi:MAG: hypothetical protein IPN95_07835 [Bacteroidetes bacterium]|jgi:hypothetical protein|nr:hypothetical protein [Bacteroidota bacterium]MBL0018689.1 hypothetical protein [Bacteroidota bacterium]MBP6640095.1 hypothetical protein [Bacteroidia bacterium]MBP8074187.1 hypothetical protein [Bacteroidia bacterium]